MFLNVFTFSLNSYSFIHRVHVYLFTTVTLTDRTGYLDLSWVFKECLTNENVSGLLWVLGYPNIMWPCSMTSFINCKKICLSPSVAAPMLKQFVCQRTSKIGQCRIDSNHYKIRSYNEFRLFSLTLVIIFKMWPTHGMHTFKGNKGKLVCIIRDLFVNYHETVRYFHNISREAVWFSMGTVISLINTLLSK